MQHFFKKNYIIPAVITYQATPLQISSKVLDVLGNAVSTFGNENQDAGTYEIVYDASILKCEVYFIQFIGGRSILFPASIGYE